MRELDLIPADYRLRRWQLRQVKYVLAGTGVAVAIAIAIAIGAVRERSSLLDEIDALAASRAELQKKAADYQALNAKVTDAQATLDRLLQMRTGASAADVLNTVNGAIGDKAIWFDSWEFRRTGVVEDTQPAAVQTGYFLVTPAKAGDSQVQALVETHMTIRGQASDHGALSDFVKSMIAQPSIAEVHVLRTYKQSERGDTPLRFDVAIVLQTPVRS